MSLKLAKEVLRTEAEGITSLIDQLDEQFERAIELIMNCPSRLIITGIGKSGIIGQKISATLNSTGTASFFLHPVEAMHGDLGIVAPDDVVLAISYSGETVELTMLLHTLRTRKVKTIALTGNVDSGLAELADVVLSAHVSREACPLGLAPTTSTTAALALGDALAVVLLDRKHFEASDFRRNHPGGSLGERLKTRVSEVMLTGGNIPQVAKETIFFDALAVLNEKNVGAVLIMDNDNSVIGIITDGDIRRLVAADTDLAGLQLTDIMTREPKFIDADLLAADALSIM
ncbi:MAG TPA: KpsF/GutQ family sugar-phosphate isomerase, partial [Desulfobulbaceae bacterium]|nr:KpsF/GutQ family sugar-phosphate isomerase [Desulfobulbaceae bacterium]